jgi:hypothetical protein
MIYNYNSIDYPNKLNENVVDDFLMHDVNEMLDYNPNRILIG